MASLLYDVVSVGPHGQAVGVMAAGVSMDQALALLNARDPDRHAPAVVAFSGTFLPQTTINAAIESEAPSVDSDASEAEDDSEAIETTEDAAGSELVAGSFVTVRLLRYKCETTGERIWWPKPLSKKRAAGIARELERRGRSPEVVTVRMTSVDIFSLAASGPTEPLTPDESKTYRILCIPYHRGAPFLTPGRFSYEQAQEWMDTWEGDATPWIVEDTHEADSEPEEAEAEPTYRVVVMEGSGDVKILPGRFTYKAAQQWQETFDQVTYLADDLPAPVAEYDCGPVKDARARFVQSAVRSQLEVIRQALPHVSDSGDIGLLAMSLREVAKEVDGIGNSIVMEPDDWGFDEAMGAEGWVNDRLKAALGMVA